MMVDFNVWPHAMRIPLVLYCLAPDVTLDKARYPSFLAWMVKMREVPAVQKTDIDKDVFKRVLESAKANGGKPNYDLANED